MSVCMCVWGGDVRNISREITRIFLYLMVDSICIYVFPAIMLL